MCEDLENINNTLVIAQRLNNKLPTMIEQIKQGCSVMICTHHLQNDEPFNIFKVKNPSTQETEIITVCSQCFAKNKINKVTDTLNTFETEVDRQQYNEPINDYITGLGKQF